MGVAFAVMLAGLVYALHLAGQAQDEIRAERLAQARALCAEITTNRGIVLRAARREQRVYSSVAAIATAPAVRRVLQAAVATSRADEALLATPPACEAILAAR